MKKLIFYILVLFSISGNSQTTLFTETFEACGTPLVLSGVSQCGWRAATFSGGPRNRWEIRTSACRITGNRSLQITNNGTECTYRKTQDHATVGYYATPINATGYYCNTMTFNWKADGEVVSGTIYDYLMPFYSLDGLTWAPCGLELYGSDATQSATVSFPSDCDNTSFYIGFYWENDIIGGNDVPAIIDDIVVQGNSASPPANDNCASATALTFTSGVATVTGTNLCATPDLINSACFDRNRNVWYSFVATQADYYVSLQTGTMSIPALSILSMPTACNATGATEFDCTATLGTSANASACGLTVGNTYYVMVDNFYYGKPGTFTLSVQAAITNDRITTPNVVNTCGASFNSSTIGATNCGDCDASFNDLDCNNGTGTFGGGGDVGFSVENSSWYAFCSTGAATYTVTMTNTGSCTGVDGLQLAAFTGTAASLTLVSGGTAGMNVLNGNTFATTGIALAANACAYIAVDGFAGTNCNYSLSLTGTPACVLPIEMLYFKGTRYDGKNHLKWATASEKNSLLYYVERSYDAFNYETIGEIQAALNSSEKTNYSFVDEKATRPKVYYRLKHIDVNGTITYANIIALNESDSHSDFDIIEISPNPVADDSKVVFAIPYAGTLNYSVYDSQGTIVSTKKIEVEEGTHVEFINTKEVNSGVYFVRAQLDDFEVHTKYFVKIASK